MALNLTSTKDAASVNGVNMMVYGSSGAGKTTLAGTWDNEKTLIISAEGGVLSLADKDIAVVEVRSMSDMREVFDWIQPGAEGEHFKLIVFDSISEIAEVCLNEEKAKVKDARKAYMELNDIMGKLIRAFRDLPEKHTLVIAKMERIKDDLSGTLVYSPAAPGAKLAASLPYQFDICMAMRSENGEEGEVRRYLQTQPDTQYIAKDRSNRLEFYEEPNLTTIISKIEGKA